MPPDGVLEPDEAPGKYNENTARSTAEVRDDLSAALSQKSGKYTYCYIM